MSERDVILFGIALILASGFFLLNGAVGRGEPSALAGYGVLGGLVVSLLGTAASVVDEPN